LFDSHQKSTGTQYVITVALLSVACVFSPALLLVSRNFGPGSVWLAVACSTLCAGLAWFNWKNRSELTIPSLETTPARVK
jgi:hypothetical protein